MKSGLIFQRGLVSLALLILGVGFVEARPAAEPAQPQGSLQVASNLKTTGDALLKEGRTAEAIAAYKQSLAAKPDFAPAIVALADLYFEKTKQFAEAIPLYQRLRILQPANFRAAYRLGWALSDGQRYEEALIALRDAAGLSPTDSAIRGEIGYACYKLNRDTEALASYQEAVRLQQDNAVAWFGLGDVYYYHIKNNKEAKGHYEQGLRYSPDNARVRYLLGWIDNDLEDYAGALPHLTEAVRLAPTEATYEVELGFCLRKVSRFKDAVDAYQNAIRLDPKLASGYVGLGDLIYYDLKVYADAIEPYQKAVRLRPDDGKLYYRLGWCLNDGQRYSEAIGPLKEAVRLQPTDVASWAELGNTYLNLNNLAEAAGAERQAINLSASSALAHYYMALIDLRMGNKAEAAREYDTLVALKSDFAKRIAAQVGR